MKPIRVLAISSSRVGNSGYLENAVPLIKNFLGSKPLNISFIPFAGVTKSDEEYISMVKDGLQGLHHSIHLVQRDNAISAIKKNDAIMVGGGNTFKLLHDIYEYNLFKLISKQVNGGKPYIGWSAGSNITGATIRTTNDMPIIEPKSFKAFNFFPFQINPHYINVKPEGHNGETRDERLMEFIKLNPSVPVVGVSEGTALQLEGETSRFIGEQAGVLFRSEENTGAPVKEHIPAGTDLSHLLS